MDDRAGRWEYNAPKWVDLASEPEFQPADHDDAWFHTEHPHHEAAEPAAQTNLLLQAEAEAEAEAAEAAEAEAKAQSVEAEAEAEAEVGMEVGVAEGLGENLAADDATAADQEEAMLDDAAAAAAGLLDKGARARVVEYAPGAEGGAKRRRVWLGGSARRVQPARQEPEERAPAGGERPPAAASRAGANDQVAAWLAELGLSDTCGEAFRAGGIGQEALAALGHPALEALGVHRLGDRLRLRARAQVAVGAARAAVPPPQTTTSPPRTTAPAPDPTDAAQGTAAVPPPPRNHAEGFGRRGAAARASRAPARPALVAAYIPVAASAPSARPGRPASAAVAKGGAGIENGGGGGGGGGDGGGARSFEEMLREHNRQHRPKATYLPAKFGVADVRAWEAASGRRWHSLSASEREVANEEMRRARERSGQSGLR